MSDKKETSFDLGTIVLQYIDDGACLVGVVVDDEMVCNVKEYGEDWFDRRFAEEIYCEFQILLVLGFFTESGGQELMFGSSHPKFPCYMAGEKRTSTPVSLEDEINLFLSHRNEKISRGLNRGRLRNRIFRFDQKRSEILGLVLATQEYLKRKTAEEILGGKSFWMGIYERDLKIFFDELKKAIPR